MNKNIFYVYAYLRSKDSETAKAGTPYYIGKGVGARAYIKHRSPNITPNDRANILIVSENLLEDDAHLLEIELISKYGRVDNGTGILWNFTDGGEGQYGRICTEETRKN